MKIAHINTERTWRGGERQTFWLARELHRLGHESWVACRPGYPLERACRAAGLPVIALNPLMEADVLAAFRLRFELLRRGVEVLHAHTGHGVGLGAMAVWGTSLRFIATRRVDFPVKGNVFSRWKHSRLDVFVAISEKVREVLQGCGVPPFRIDVIPSGLDVSSYPGTANRDLYREQRGYNKGDTLVVNVGALVHHKGHTYLVEAIPRVLKDRPRTFFIVLGEGTLRGDLEKTAAKLGIGRNLRLAGQREDVLEYIAMADLFVFPSVAEGLGTSLLDALAIGVPTVAARAGGIPEIYGSADAPELVSPRDPVDLAEGILRVLTDPREAALRVERGRKRVERFSVGSMTRRYEGIYRRLIEKGREP